MLITHAMNPTRIPKSSQTPKRKIKQIVTLKNQLPTKSHQSYLSNKQNQHPNILKSNQNQKPKPSNQKQTQNKLRVNTQNSKELLRVSPKQEISFGKQSPIKKILFVRNIGYKSNKTSKNSSLQRKDNPIYQANNTYLGLNLGSQNPLITKVKQNTLISKDKQHPIIYKQRLYEQNYHALEYKSQYVNNQNQTYKQIYNNEPNHTNEANQHNKIKQKPSYVCTSNQMIMNQQKKSLNRNQPSQSLQPSTLSNKPNIQKVTAQQTLKQPLQRAKSFHINSSNEINRINKKINQTQFSGNQVGKLNFIQGNLHNSNFNDKINKQHIYKEAKDTFLNIKRNSKVKISLKDTDKQRKSLQKQDFQDKISFINQNQMFQSFSKDGINFMTSAQNNPYQANQSTIKKAPEHNNSYPSIDDSDNKDLKFLQQSTTNLTLNQTKSQMLEQTLKNQEFDSMIFSISPEKQIQVEIVKVKTPLLNLKAKCYKHPQKEAKFKIDLPQERSYYCSKCTVLLVTQGHHVIKNLQQPQNRSCQLNSFLSQTRSLQSSIQSSLTKSSLLYQQVNENFNKSMKQIISYYTQLAKVLQIQKQQAIKGLKYNFQELKGQIQQLVVEIKQIHQEIIFIRNDIQPNLTQILDQQRLNKQCFQQIIQEHTQRLSIIQKDANVANLIVQGKNKHAIIFKTVNILPNQLKNSVNLMQRLKVVFVSKSLKIDNEKIVQNNMKKTVQSMNKTYQKQMDPKQKSESKQNFSFEQQNGENSFFMPSPKKKAKNSTLIGQHIYQLDDMDSARLSFGKQLQCVKSSVKSPTFKII